MRLHCLPIVLLTIAVSAHATIYQCGNSFQGTPCRGAIIRSGAPTASGSQAAVRISSFASGQNKLYAELQAKQQAAASARAQIAAIRSQQLRQEQTARNANIRVNHHHILHSPINTNGGHGQAVGNGNGYGKPIGAQ